MTVLRGPHPVRVTGLQGAFPTPVLCCLRGKLPAIVKNKPPAQSRRVAAREEYMTISRRNFARLAAASGAVAVASPAIAQGAIKWRLASSFPKSIENLWNVSPVLAKLVNEMSDGKFVIEPFA